MSQSDNLAHILEEARMVVADQVWLVRGKGHQPRYPELLEKIDRALLDYAVTSQVALLTGKACMRCGRVFETGCESCIGRAA